MSKTSVREQIHQSLLIKKKIFEDEVLINLIAEIAEVCTEVIRNGGKIMLAGNGGSAADSQHIAGELVSRFYFDRPGLPAMALTTDTSILTAIGNDYGYEKLFSRQIQANGLKGDLFIAISTSGNSQNLVEALEESKAKGLITVGLTGKRGGKILGFCDYCVKIPSLETPRIQEAHILVGHVLCAIIEENIFGEERIK